MCNALTFGNLFRFLDGESLYAVATAFGRENSETMRKAFLRPTSDLVSTIPCGSYDKDVCGTYCPRNTLYDGGSRRVLAYCPRMIAPDESLSDEEIRVFQPNLPMLLQRVADALKIRPGVAEETADWVWRLGEFSPSAARKYPVFLIMYTHHRRILDAVCRLLLEYASGPLIIFCPSETPPDSSTMRALNNRRSLLINIDDCLNISFSGEVSLKVERRCIFAPLTEKADQPADSSFGYDFPLGTTWEDLLIHYQDDPEKVAFQIGGTTSMHTRTEMKIGQKQWVLLRSFAEKFGKLPSAGILQNDALKKQLERLNRGLKEYFRTKEDAIVLSDDQSEYVCRFKLKPSWHSTIHHVKKRG